VDEKDFDRRIDHAPPRSGSEHVLSWLSLSRERPRRLAALSFPFLYEGKKPWNNFVRFEADEYSFTPSRDTDLLVFLKPFLLYSHGICFLDPLPGLLDYFRPSSEESDFEKARLSGVAQLLLEYVKIADLIRHRIVVPISDEVFGFYSHNNFVLSDKEEREIIDLLADIPRYQKQAENVHFNHHLGHLGQLIKEQLWLKKRAENRIDLYFPHDSCVPILQGLLGAASHRTSKEIYEPFAVGVLADLASLDTSQISIMDIISIRSEHAFDDYRKVLQGILRRLQDREGKFSDLESEFAVAAREEMAECDDKIKQLTKKSNVLKDTLKNLDRVLIGGASGSLPQRTSGRIPGSRGVRRRRGSRRAPALRHRQGRLDGLVQLRRTGEPSPSLPRARPKGFRKPALEPWTRAADRAERGRPRAPRQ
jgi:hypothetical protein